MLRQIIQLLTTAARQTRTFILALLLLFRVISRGKIVLQRHPWLSTLLGIAALIYAGHRVWTTIAPEDLIRTYYYHLNRWDFAEAYQCWEDHENWSPDNWTPDYIDFTTQFKPTIRTDVDSVSVENLSKGIWEWLLPQELQVTTEISFTDVFSADYLQDPTHRTDALCAEIYNANEYHALLADGSGKGQQKVKRSAKIQFVLTRSGLRWRIHDSNRVYLGIYSQ